MACEQFLRTLPATAPDFSQARGIVLCSREGTRFSGIRACIQRLRRLGCRLPVQVWQAGGLALSPRIHASLARVQAQWVDASRCRTQFPGRILHQPQLQACALLYSPFREVLLLDGEQLPGANPESFFHLPEFQAKGALFWPEPNPDSGTSSRTIWRSCGLRQPREPEPAPSPMLVDKQRCWRALRLALWFHENANFYYQHLPQDRQIMQLAFRKLKRAYGWACPAPSDAS